MKIYIIERCADMSAAKTYLLDKYAREGEEYFVEYLPTGQPTLVSDGRQAGHISISHTASTLVMAFSDKPVGVDVELSARKTSRIAMDVEEWTRREAYGKFLGVGINRQILSARLPDDLIKTFKHGEYVISVCGEGDVEEVVAFIDNR